MVAKNHKEQSHWYFYLARCADQSLYAGITTDLKRREHLHNTGRAAKYTRSRRPIQIVYTESFLDESTARKREIEVKRWTRLRKQMLVKSGKN